MDQWHLKMLKGGNAWTEKQKQRALSNAPVYSAESPFISNSNSFILNIYLSTEQEFF